MGHGDRHDPPAVLLPEAKPPVGDALGDIKRRFVDLLVGFGQYAPAGERLGLQFALLGIAAVVYALATVLSCRASMARFEKIDL